MWPCVKYITNKQKLKAISRNDDGDGKDDDDYIKDNDNINDSDNCDKDDNKSPPPHKKNIIKNLE